MLAQRARRGAAFEAPCRTRRDARTELALERLTQFGFVVRQVLAPQEFGGGQAAELVGEVVLGEILDQEASGRQVDPSESRAIVVDEQAGEEVVRARVERVLFGDRARGDDAHDRAIDDALGLFGIRHLLADGDLVPLLDEAHQVPLHRLDRHAGHRQRVGRALRARGQRDPELARRDLRVVAEQLVEVAHPEEEQCIGLLLLGSPELVHHPDLGLLGGFRLLLRLGHGGAQSQDWGPSILRDHGSRSTVQGT